MKSNIVQILILSFFISIYSVGCAPLQKKLKGMKLLDVVPTLMGTVIGAAADDRNRWRGGAIGAVGGFLTGMTIKEMMKQATEESAKTGKPVVYEDQKGNKVEAVSKPIKGVENCSEVTRTVTMNGEEEISAEKICEIKTTKNIY